MVENLETQEVEEKKTETLEVENEKTETPKVEEKKQEVSEVEKSKQEDKNEKEESKEDPVKADAQYKLNKKMDMLNIVGVFHDKNSGGILLGVTSTGGAKLIDRNDADFILAYMNVVSPGKESYAIGDSADGNAKELDQTKKQELDEKGDRIQEAQQKENKEDTAENAKKEAESSKEREESNGLMGRLLTGRPLPEDLQKKVSEVYNRALENFSKDVSKMLDRGGSVINKYMGKQNNGGGRP